MRGVFFGFISVGMTPNLDLLNNYMFFYRFEVYELARKMWVTSYLWLNCHKTPSTNRKS